MQGARVLDEYVGDRGRRGRRRQAPRGRSPHAGPEAAVCGETSSEGALRLPQDVADAAHRVKQPRVAVLLELAPQVPDVDAE
jgi:hypothetical protein